MLNNEKRYVVWIVILTYQYIAMATVTIWYQCILLVLIYRNIVLYHNDYNYIDFL